MRQVILGRTGLKVSVMGLGAGGASRIGQGTGRTEAESVAVVRRALDLGVNIIDTAEVYGTEAIVAKAIRESGRKDVVISTKKTTAVAGRPVTPGELADGLEGSLTRLGVERVDIYHLHGVSPDHYRYTRENLVPAMLKLKSQGKIGFLGITEAFESDRGHRTLAEAVKDDCWDVIMVGFNLLNQAARERVLPACREKAIGVLNMFAVRRALGDWACLEDVLADLGKRELVDGRAVKDTLDSLIREGGAASLQDAAYRFCRYEPGIHVVLSGTGNLGHLKENVDSLARPPLPAEAAARLRGLLVRVDDISGD